MIPNFELSAPVKPVTSSFKRIALLGAFCATVGAYFWLKSRYPALDMKSLMGERTGTFGISFDVVIPAVPGDSILTRILKATLNWCYTNWKGMTFAVLFGGGTLALFHQIRFRGFRSPWLNSAMGMIYGAPLGVCANCAAPVSKALYQGGYSTETTLAALFASPTLNVVVLGMLFDFLPAPMAWTKLGLTFLMILAGVPLLARVTRSSREKLEAAPPAPAHFPAYIHESWLSALRGAGLSLAHSFGYIFVTTVPFMFLAGFLGSALVELLPMGTIAQWPVTLPGLAAAALVGTFLPVPMSFDVIMVTILMEGGLNTAYSMVLLCTLGCFSVYPLLILWRTISWRLAAAVFATVAVLGTAAAGLTELVFDRQFKDNLARTEAAWTQGLASIKPFMENTLGATCKKLPAPDAAACLSQVARSLKSTLPCEGIAEEDLFQECKVNGLAGLYLERVEECSRFGKEKFVRLCQDIAFSEFVNGPGHPGRKELHAYCADMTSPHMIQLCQDADLQIRAHRLTNPAACARLQDPVAASLCFKRIVSRGNISDNLVESCESFKAREKADACRLMVVRYSPMDRATELCDQAQGRFASECRKELLRRTAKKESEPTLCFDSFQSPSERAECLGGVATKIISKQMNISNVKEIRAMLKNGEPPEGGPPSPAEARFQARPLILEKRGPGIYSFPHDLTARKAAQTPFVRHEGTEYGLLLPESLPSDYRHVSTTGRGLAAGDFNKDGWPDLVLATREGPFIYRNLGGMRFQREALDFSPPRPGAEDISIAAFVDIDGDGWLDIFCGSRVGAAFFLMNYRGRFDSVRAASLPDAFGRYVVRAAAFADVDRDGSIDVYLGNWSGGHAPYTYENATNELYLNRSMKFVRGPYTDSVRSATLATLFSDVNQDGFTDLFVGNDFNPPDEILFGTRDGRFKLISPEDRIFPYTSKATMSYDSADINNDLRLDVYSTDILLARDASKPYCSFIIDPREKADCEAVLRTAEASDTSYISNCHELPTSAKRLDCATTILRNTAKRLGQERLCETIPDFAAATRWACLAKFREAVVPLLNQRPLPQVARNLLFIQKPDGTFDEKAGPMGVENTAWGWAGKFADLDNDGWQDLYVSAGGGGANLRAVRTNYLFWNKQGARFDPKRENESESGLRERFISTSFVYTDLDRDGDLDIISNAVNGPLRIYLNHSAPEGAHSITLALHSSTRNTHAIGARVTATYGGGKKQIREVKSSGGYLSFDPPELHFGLGEATEIERLDVIWPDGRRTEFADALPAGHHYVIEEPGSALARR